MGKSTQKVIYLEEGDLARVADACERWERLFGSGSGSGFLRAMVFRGISAWEGGEASPTRAERTPEDVAREALRLPAVELDRLALLRAKVNELRGERDAIGDADFVRGLLRRGATTWAREIEPFFDGEVLGPDWGAWRTSPTPDAGKETGPDPRDPDDSALHALLGPLGIDRWEVQGGTLWITALRPGVTHAEGRRLAAINALGPGWRVELALDPVAPPPRPGSIRANVTPERVADLAGAVGEALRSAGIPTIWTALEEERRAFVAACVAVGAIVDAVPAPSGSPHLVRFEVMAPDEEAEKKVVEACKRFRVEALVNVAGADPEDVQAGGPTPKPSDLVQRLTDMARDRGLDVVVIPRSSSSGWKTVVRVVGGPDQGIHALRRDLAGPCGARGALVVDGRHSKLHDVTAGDPEPQQASADPDATSGSRDPAEPVPATWIGKGWQGDAPEGRSLPCPDPVRRLAASPEDLVGAWQVSDAARERIEAEIRELPAEDAERVRAAIADAMRRRASSSTPATTQTPPSVAPGSPEAALSAAADLPAEAVAEAAAYARKRGRPTNAQLAKRIAAKLGLDIAIDLRAAMGPTVYVRGGTDEGIATLTRELRSVAAVVDQRPEGGSPPILDPKSAS